MFVMSSCKSKEKGRSKKEKRGALRAGPGRVVLTFCLLHFAFFLSACRRDMQDQPKAIAYRESAFFKDGVSSRPPVAGTVSRGHLRADREFYFGKKNGYGTADGSQRVENAGKIPTNRPPDASAPNAAAMFPDDVDTIPIPITRKVLDDGQERYQIFCSSCHGLTGYGDGMIARRGFNKPAPASFHQDKLRQAPVGHFFDVITNGWGAMASHASQIPVEDRWKIIAYVRALQLSQMAPGSSPTVREGAKTQK